MTRILVTNDDGVGAEGIQCLARELREVGDVTVVAPDREKSAAGHSLTLNRPLRLQELGDEVYSVDGTPTDCVNLAVLWLLEGERPDLLVSGINHGLNLGDDVTYSGTVSAAFEGHLLGIPSVAFSQDVRPEADFERAAHYAAEFIRQVINQGLSRETLLNVNLPSGQIKGSRWCRLGHREYKQVVVEKSDPRGRRYFWIAGEPEWKADEGTDHQALSQGFASITPLHLDLTDYKELAEASAGRASLSGLDTLREPASKSIEGAPDATSEAAAASKDL